jgi:PPOX class probable F420-dependent enzyme
MVRLHVCPVTRWASAVEPGPTMPVCNGAPASAGNQFPGKYLSLTSFKRDGSGVATPVWFVIENGRLLVKTDAQSFTGKRVRRNATVTIASCTASGRLRGEPTPAHTELLPQSNIDRVDQLLAGKYRVDKILILPLYRAMQKLRGAHAETAGVALAITPSTAASNARSSQDSPLRSRTCKARNTAPAAP